MLFLCYDKSLRFGLRDGSFDSNPKVNKDTKKITLVYTTIFNTTMIYLLVNRGNKFIFYRHCNLKKDFYSMQNYD